jgi:hypothetical protein
MPMPGAHSGREAMDRAPHVVKSRFATDDWAPRSTHAYDAFFEFWKRADPDVALLGQARAEYAKLGT